MGVNKDLPFDFYYHSVQDLLKTDGGVYFFRYRQVAAAPIDGETILLGKRQLLDQVCTIYLTPIRQGKRHYCILKMALGREDKKSICESALDRDYAAVSTQVPKQRMAKISKDVRTTFQSRLSSLGGTLGLFSGTSLVSLVEAGFWAYRAIADQMS